MKKALSLIILVSLTFSLVSCSYSNFETLTEWFGSIFGSKNQSETTDDYKVPIILLHGRISNTAIFFGVETQIEKDQNNQYDTDTSENGLSYTSPESHKITNIKNGKLGAYLKKLGYEENKNLFAFNYPNEDMIGKNSKKLYDYIENLIEWAADERRPDVVDSSIFATQQDRKDRNVKFILIGHSMGGLISRYYIENRNGDEHVDKLITIDTPHYGSKIANMSDDIELAFIPADIDLRLDSKLFTGEPYNADSNLTKESFYGVSNQSEQLRGNRDTEVEYYAIGGYDTDVDEENAELIHDKLSFRLAKRLKNGEAFSISFERFRSSKQAFKDAINNALMIKSLNTFGEKSTLYLGDDDGDNVVNYMSQFAIRFDDEGNTIDYQRIEEATLILATGYNFPVNMYHSEIASEPLMHEAVKKYIQADTDEVNDDIDSVTSNDEINNWTMVNAWYDESQNHIVLTEDCKKWQCGSIWYNDPLTEDFIFEMDYYTGSEDRVYGGADGIVVAFYANKEYQQQSGLDIGFTGCQGYGIELDTYYNIQRDDPSRNNHIALVKERVANHIVYSDLAEAEDEQWHHLKIVVENGVCEAYVDGVLKISSEVEKTGYQYLGITSATGEGNNLHAVKNITVINNG